MEPFSIVCLSCASKLKVTKASAVGQVLACPNCGTMIKVTPPEGWVAPHETADSLPDMTSSANSLGGDFDDIDSILGNANPQPKPKPTRTSQRSSQSSPKSKQARQRSAEDQAPNANESSLQTSPPSPSRERHKKRQQTLGKQPNGIDRTPIPRPKSNSRPAASAESAQTTVPSAAPILPTDQWTGEGTKKRQKVVMAVVGVLATFVLLGAIGVAIVMNIQKPPAVAEIPKEKNVAPQEVERPPVVEEQPAPKVEKEPEAPFENVLEEDNLLEEDALMVKKAEKPVVQAPEVTLSMSPLDIEEKPRKIEKPGLILEEVERPKKLALTTSPFDSVELGPAGPKIDIEIANKKTTVPTTEATPSDNAKQLSALLEESGTTLSDIKDLTSLIRNETFVGLPKYVVEKPDPLRLDFDKLEFIVGGLKYEQATLSRVLRNLTAISGVPITLNARSIVTSGHEPNPRIETLVANSDLNTAIDEVVEPFGFQKTLGTNGIIIGITHSSEALTEKHDLSELPRFNRPQELISYIKTMIQPKIWVDKSSRSTLKISGKQLVANCNAEAQLQIKQLLAKMSASAKLSKDPESTVAQKVVCSRWDSIKTKLERSPNLSHSLQADLGSFLSKLETNTSVTILVDWVNVSGLGWNQHTMIPGNMRESSLAKVIAELCHSMHLTSIAVDENTMILTTPEAAAQTFDLEVYPVQQMIAAGFDEQQILILTEQALGRQVHFKIYDPNCQCLIVAAPQSVQKQVEALIARISGR